MMSQDFNSKSNEMNMKEEISSGDELGDEFILDIHPTGTQYTLDDTEIEIKHEETDYHNTSTSDTDDDFHCYSDIKTVSNIHHVDVDCTSVKCEGNDLNTHDPSQPTEDPLSIDHDSPPFDQSSYPVKCEVDEYSIQESEPKSESDPDFELEKGNDPEYTPSSQLTPNIHRRSLTRHNTTSDSKRLKANSGIPSSQEQFICTVCDKRLMTQSDLIIHMSIHTGGKPFECVECEMRFTRLDHLKAHKRIHTGERPYKCDVCEKTFGRSSELNRHKMVHTGVRPFTCDVCEKSFSMKCSLTTHSRIHTGERPFTCDVCEKSFPTSGQLNSHMKTHTREKPFKCNLCEKTFGWSGPLARHKRVHTGERPYTCDGCEKTFRTSSHLNKHKKTSVSCGGRVSERIVK